MLTGVGKNFNCFLQQNIIIPDVNVLFSLPIAHSNVPVCLLAFAHQETFPQFRMLPESTDIFSTDTFRELIITIYRRTQMRTTAKTEFRRSNTILSPISSSLSVEHLNVDSYHPFPLCFNVQSFFFFYGVFTWFIYLVAIDCDNNMFVGCSGMLHPRVFELFLCECVTYSKRAQTNEQSHKTHHHIGLVLAGTAFGTYEIVLLGLDC